MFDARRPLGWLFLLLPAMVALAVSAQTLPPRRLAIPYIALTELPLEGRC
jgi:4-hydroxybenzoate polyprenyltransferase